MDSDAIRKLLDEATPGPLVVSFESVDPEWCVVTTTGGAVIANVNADHRQQANARLIAAAPDLAAEVLRLRDRLIAEEEAKIRLAYIAAEEIGKLKDLLTEALPWVDAQLDDPANKPGTVRAIASRIRAAVKENPDA